MADDYFAVLAYDHRVMCGFYNHRPSYDFRVSDSSKHSDSSDSSDSDFTPPYFDIDDDDIII